MDNCLIHFFVQMIRDIAESEKLFSVANKLSDSQLRLVYDEAKKYEPSFTDSAFFELFELGHCTNSQDFISEVLTKYFERVPLQYRKGLKIINEEGNLSKRLVKLGLSQDTYRLLIKSLSKNSPLTIEE